jgi:hypothetical protein
LEAVIMPRYYFDQRRSYAVVDPAGRECKDDAAAKEMARILAIGVSLDTPAIDPTRLISVLNEARQEIFQKAILFKASMMAKPALMCQASSRHLLRKHDMELWSGGCGWHASRIMVPQLALRFYLDVAGTALEGGTKHGLHDLEAIRYTINGWYHSVEELR